MTSCEDCGISFSREDNLRGHKNHHCKAGEKYKACKPKRRQFSRFNEDSDSEDEMSLSGDKIPTFDGDEFCGNKPQSRETLY